MSFNKTIEKCSFCYLWFNKASWNKSAPLILSGAKQAKHFQLKAWRRCFPSKYIHVGNSGCNSWMLKACRVSSHLHGSSHRPSLNRERYRVLWYMYFTLYRSVTTDISAWVCEFDQVSAVKRMVHVQNFDIPTWYPYTTIARQSMLDSSWEMVTHTSTTLVP